MVSSGAATGGANTCFTASYDGDGLRVGKWDTWTGQHDYTRSAEGVLFDSSGSTVYTPGFAQRSGGVDRFSQSDWLGSTRYLSDGTGDSFPSGLRCSAFGERSATGGTDPFDPSDFQFGASSGYQTEYASASEPGLGLAYLQQRYYDPATGRFISRDPIGLEGGLNLFAYVGNSPVNSLDPTGLNPDIDIDGEKYRARVGDPDDNKGHPHWDRVRDNGKTWLDRNGKIHHPDGSTSDIPKKKKREFEKQRNQWDNRGDLPVMDPKPAVAVGIGLLLVWEGTKWVAAVLAAPATAGVSLVGAAASP